ncbi:IclR family transcriptional regulator [Primorskyibacter sp. 2E233]|uniref:IclR family transcriptional regulator n=1 Tax=Primorskyibacter sp. 2E233 TaxID=3413431 RepID=UPI003BF005C4
MNAADRLLTILGLFSEDRPRWSAEDMMAATGFTRPTLYRYLKNLRDAGLLMSSGASFMLGPKVTEMDYLMQRADPVIAAGQGALRLLAQTHPGSAFLARWYGRRILCVASESSAPGLRSSYPRGRPMPLARGAISRVILAHLPKREQEAIGGENLGEFARTGTGETVQEIRATLRRVRREGVAVAHGEVTPGVVGIAAPLLEPGGTPVAALCFTVDEAGLNASQLAHLRATVRAQAQDVSARLAELEEVGHG